MLPKAAQATTRPLLSTRKIADANSVSPRTVERWTETGILPPPVRINGRKFWPEGTTPKLDPPEAA